MTAKPLLLDLFCKQGGAGKGYADAGFEVVGVDIEPQPRYPFEFIQVDALGAAAWIFDTDFDAIHASPPCQAHVKGLGAVNKALGRSADHVDLISVTRTLLQQTGLPYVIENVEGAPLINPIKLCGSSFGLAVRRHRLFESNVPLMAPPCAHHLQRERRHWTSWRPNGEKRLATVVQVYGNAGDSSEWSEAMGIDWMDRDGLTQAIPPAYTEHIGEYLMRAIELEAAA